MPNQGSGASDGALPEGARAPSLPDLAGVDLHELWDMDDPALLAAVDEVLRRPELFTAMWANEGGNGGDEYRRRHPVSRSLPTGRPGA